MKKNLTYGIVAICALLLTVPATAQVLTIEAGDDLWATSGDGTTYFNLTSANMDELCNYKGASHTKNGKDEVTKVVMKGVPFNQEESNADTAVTRLQSASFSGYGETVSIPVQVSGLQFAGSVEANCGTLGLSVSLSGEQSVSMASITLDSPEGGSFTTDLPVSVIIAASGGANGSTIVSGVLRDSGSEPWSTKAPPNSATAGPFNPGVINGGPVVICRKKGVVYPAWHCYTPAQASPNVATN